MFAPLLQPIDDSTVAWAVALLTLTAFALSPDRWIRAWFGGER